ncbi:MAG: T9SS type A sorting domain-containing protein [Weeksellaceae bacterium]|nr:T9SS type A sorting domain-containing protein [Weeksellaceae bacterium]
MKTIFTLSFFSIFGMHCLFAQYTTPGNGNSYSLTDLVEISNGVVIDTNDAYLLNSDLTIAANDTLYITEDGVWNINPDVLITVFGAFITQPPQEFTIRSSAEGTHFQGIRFEDGSHAHIFQTKILYGGGVRVLSDDFYMSHSEVSHQIAGVSTGGAISFSYGQPYVGYSKLSMNDMPAFSSGANSSVGARFYNNVLEYNTMLNQNRPQINMGASGVNDTIFIVNNTIIGLRDNTMAGGISASSLLGIENTVHIEGNIIRDNRYGITVAGAASKGVIFDNIIEDNDTQNNPAQGGSGISLNATGEPSMDIIVHGNQIRRNLWGITVINQARINLGDGTAESPGENIFAENGNGGDIYALYNNTAHDIEAQNNCWIEGQDSTAEQVEEVIVHQLDIDNLGLVNFTPFLCSTLSTEDTNLMQKVQISPNPAKEFFVISNAAQSKYEIYDMSGKVLQNGSIDSESYHVAISLQPGKYIVVVSGSEGRRSLGLLVR